MNKAVISTVSKQAVFLQRCVDNIGNAMAYDVRFKLSHPIPKVLHRYDSQDIKTVNHMDSGPLIEGISALEPGGTRNITLGQFNNISDALKDKKLVITCCFKKGSGQRSSIDCPSIDCHIDINSFLATDISSKKFVELVSIVEKIARDIRNVSTNFSELRTHIESSPKNKSDT